jgi:hypothetical protein
MLNKKIKRQWNYTVFNGFEFKKNLQSVQNMTNNGFYISFFDDIIHQFSVSNLKR